MTDFLDKARSQVADGKYRAAIESLYAAVPTALGGDARQMRAVLELATTIHDRVDRRLQRDCEDIAASMSKALDATPGRGETILIATFNDTTGWRGKTITYDDDRFTLEGHGRVSPTNIMKYDGQAQLVWSNEGTRAWVGSQALGIPIAPHQGGQLRQVVTSGKVRTCPKCQHRIVASDLDQCQLDHCPNCGNALPERIAPLTFWQGYIILCGIGSVSMLMFHNRVLLVVLAVVVGVVGLWMAVRDLVIGWRKGDTFLRWHRADTYWERNEKTADSKVQRRKNKRQ